MPRASATGSCCSAAAAYAVKARSRSSRLSPNCAHRRRHTRTWRECFLHSPRTFLSSHAATILYYYPFLSSRAATILYYYPFLSSRAATILYYYPFLSSRAATILYYYPFLSSRAATILWGRMVSCGGLAIRLVGQPILAAAGFQPALLHWHARRI